MWKSRSGILSGLAMRAFYTENIKSSVPTGSMPEVENALRRCRGSMKQILSLMEVPSLETDPELAKKAKEMREQLLPGERRRVWAIEPDGPASRQPLPSWVSDPIQGAIVQWIEQKQKWDTEIESRAAKGKNLTFMRQRYYDEWKTSSREVVILFNSKNQTHVYKLRANADLKNIQKDWFSLRLHLDENPQKLTAQAGKGAACRLVLLEVEATATDGAEVPEVLNAGVDSGALEALGHGFEDGDEEECEDQGWVDQEEALLLAEQEVDAAHEIGVEVLANSSDEDMPEIVGCEKVKRVKAFHHREAFQKLEKEGLTMIPTHRHGVYLSFHQTSRTWQGFYPHVTSGLSYTFGGKTNRP